MGIDLPERLRGADAAERAHGFLVVAVFACGRAVVYHPGGFEDPGLGEVFRGGGGDGLAGGCGIGGCVCAEGGSGLAGRWAAGAGAGDDVESSS